MHSSHRFHLSCCALDTSTYTLGVLTWRNHKLSRKIKHFSRICDGHTLQGLACDIFFFPHQPQHCREAGIWNKRMGSCIIDETSKDLCLLSRSRKLFSGDWRLWYTPAAPPILPYKTCTNVWICKWALPLCLSHFACNPPPKLPQHMPAAFAPHAHISMLHGHTGRESSTSSHVILTKQAWHLTANICHFKNIFIFSLCLYSNLSISYCQLHQKIYTFTFEYWAATPEKLGSRGLLKGTSKG